MNEYEQKWLKRIKAHAKEDKNLILIINKIYEDGFEDGINENI